jgi:pimeloyl-ACP methyl ester carboxylesterase
MPYAVNQGVRIHYRIQGDGHPLVLQHGFTADRWQLAVRIRFAGLRVAPGHIIDLLLQRAARSRLPHVGGCSADPGRASADARIVAESIVAA